MDSIESTEAASAASREPSRAARAVDCHRQGYNCAQGVLIAFAGDMGLAESQAARLGAGLGGGVGQMREVCGAVVGASIALGWINGGEDAPTPERKQSMYESVRRVGEPFEQAEGTLNCMKLLGLTSRADPMPPMDERPCDRLIERAVTLLEAELGLDHER
ncbi:MAG: C-GCAxxG-C-C family protein [Oscillospiraceae bacterium]|jgi:C_GCAxxG_C_C family probable redox protein|nr:C-GCAxxG-C-C family protein [Oscillospiraceae bacterium]